jgi:serine/threonine-protein kinase
MASDDKTRIVSPDTVGPGVQLNGIYEIDERIAFGGMGEVYRGHNIQTGDPVAIKIVLPEFARDEAILALFRKEASILNHLSHDAIVRYHVFTIDPAIGRPYLAMEYVDGISVADRMAQRPFTVEEARWLLARVASGLALAHEAGVIHRDLSPDNIILPGGNVHKSKIIDFGIARAANIGGGTLLGGKFAGKYNFVSPEQLGLFGGEVTERSDIYSLGLVIAGALRGKAIDMSGSQVEVIEKRRHVPDLSDIDESMRPLLEAMLQPDPHNRPESAADIVEWLRATSDRSIPPGAAYPGLPPASVPPGLASGAGSLPPIAGRASSFPSAPPRSRPPGEPSLPKEGQGSVPSARSQPPSLRQSVPPYQGAPEPTEDAASSTSASIPPAYVSPANRDDGGLEGTPAAPVSNPPYGSLPSRPVAERPQLPPRSARSPVLRPPKRSSVPLYVLLGIVVVLAGGGGGAYLGGWLDTVPNIGPSESPKLTPAGQTDGGAAGETERQQEGQGPAGQTDGGAAGETERQQEGQGPAEQTDGGAAGETEQQQEGQGPARQTDGRAEGEAGGPREEQGQAEPVAPEATGPAAPGAAQEAGPSEQQDVAAQVENGAAWVRSFDGGSCFFARVLSVSDTAAEIEGYGLRREPFDRLLSEYGQRFGYEPTLGVRLISQEHCPVLDFLRRIQSEARNNPRVEINVDQLKLGDTLRGNVSNIGGRKIDLMMISSDGVVYSLEEVFNEDGTFSFSLVEDPAVTAGQEQPDTIPNLIVAVASPDGLPLARTALPNLAQSFFPQLAEQVEAVGEEAAAGVAYFVLRE